MSDACSTGRWCSPGSPPPCLRGPQPTCASPPSRPTRRPQHLPRVPPGLCVLCSRSRAAPGLCVLCSRSRAAARARAQSVVIRDHNFPARIRACMQAPSRLPSLKAPNVDSLALSRLYTPRWIAGAASRRNLANSSRCSWLELSASSAHQSDPRRSSASAGDVAPATYGHVSESEASEAIGGHRRPSEAIRGNQRRSEATKHCARRIMFHARNNAT